MRPIEQVSLITKSGSSALLVVSDRRWWFRWRRSERKSELPLRAGFGALRMGAAPQSPANLKASYKLAESYTFICASFRGELSGAFISPFACFLPNYSLLLI